MCGGPPVPVRANLRVETLQSTGGLPPHIAGLFTEPLSFQQAKSGHYYVFDRRAHSVYVIDPGQTQAKKIVEIGHEEGRIIEPTAFDLEPEGTFVVADAPAGRDRIQLFGWGGARLGGFTMPMRTAPRLTLRGLVLNGIGSLQYTGASILLNQPEAGALVSEYGLSGTPVRTWGTLRKTGVEDDRAAHLALNTGIPLVNPRGGYYFVFQAGAPLFRKYDRAGTLVFERHIEGRELDEVVAAMPTRWPRRRPDNEELPLVPPIVRTAAVDPEGNLWIAFTVPYTYVYDAEGDKRRTVQFRGAGLVSPVSLFFTTGARLLVAPGCYEFRY